MIKVNDKEIRDPIAKLFIFIALLPLLAFILVFFVPSLFILLLPIILVAVIFGGSDE